MLQVVIVKQKILQAGLLLEKQKVVNRARRICGLKKRGAVRRHIKTAKMMFTTDPFYPSFNNITPLFRARLKDCCLDPPTKHNSLDKSCKAAIF